MNIFKRFFGHLGTVIRHRWTVMRLCFKCGLYWKGLTHDLSKYSPTEFLNGVRFYTGTASPHIGEREKYGYSKAWLHHKGHNKHHAEYWQDIRPNGKTETIPMPKRYLAEMICDRVAASMIYLGDKFTPSSPVDYYRSHFDENQFHTQTRAELAWWLENIAACGVDEALKELKGYLKEGN